MKVVAKASQRLFNSNDIYYSDKAPEFPECDQMWTDTSKIPPVLMRYDCESEQWVENNWDAEKIDPEYTDKVKNNFTQIGDKIGNILQEMEDFRQEVADTNAKNDAYFEDVWKNIDKVEADLDATNLDLHNKHLQLSNEIDEANDDIIKNRGEYLGLYGDINGKHSILAQNVNGIAARVSDNAGNISKLTLTSDKFGVRITDAEKNISTIDQKATQIGLRVSSAEGNISTLTMDSKAIASRVSSAEGNISTVTQTAKALGTRLTTAEGNISSVTQTASSLSSRMSTAEGNISSVVQTANGLQSSVNSINNGTASIIQQMNNNINLRVKSSELISQINLNSSGVYIQGSKIMLDANTYVAGNFYAPRIYSGTSSNYTQIDGAQLTTYGHYGNTWRDKYVSGYHALTMNLGYIKMQQLTGYNGSYISSKPALYYTSRGIGTRFDGSAGGDASGVIEFFGKGYSTDANSLTIASSGNIILESTVGSRIYLNPAGAAVHVANKNDTYYDLYARKLFADGSAVTSDEKKKKNIVNYEGYTTANGITKTALEQVKDTTVKMYNLKNEDDNEKTHLGVILQEAPYDIVDPVGGVDLYAMVSLLWKAVQELSTELEKK